MLDRTASTSSFVVANSSATRSGSRPTTSRAVAMTCVATECTLAFVAARAAAPSRRSPTALSSRRARALAVRASASPSRAFCAAAPKRFRCAFTGSPSSMAARWVVNSASCPSVTCRAVATCLWFSTATFSTSTADPTLAVARARVGVEGGHLLPK